MVEATAPEDKVLARAVEWAAAQAHHAGDTLATMKRGLYPVGDYLEFRYGSPVRATITALLWIGTPALLAAQLIAMAKILSFVAGTPNWAGVLIEGIVVTAYFTPQTSRT